MTDSASSRLRWTIVALLSSSIAINLIDRQVLSVLAPVLREEMRLSATQYAYITAAFQLGMMAGQVPVGAFLDRVGTRIGLAAIFVAWSVVGGAHALASGLAGFVVLRFLMGVSECGNYTAGHQGHRRAVSRGQPGVGRRIVQCRRAVRLDRRHAARRPDRDTPRLAAWPS